MADRVSLQSKRKNHAILRQICVDICILLLNNLSNHMQFIANGYKRFFKTNSTDPRQRVPLKYSNGSTLCKVKMALTFQR